MRTTPKNLTIKQQRILDFIADYLRKRGMPPTRAEISKRFGFASWNSAQQHLKAIERKGFIKLTDTISRGIQIV